MEAEAFPMKGGDGPYSYTKNSQFQMAGSNVAKDMIKEAITEKFDITSLSSSSSNTIKIADLGCSVGPNTFMAMQNVIESMERKCNSHDPTTKIPEFHLFFNDHASNDFNTLFTSLPLNSPYFAAGVPGSFHGRLFPKSSLHFVNSSYALQWLSKVPEDLLDKNSPAWNKGRIHYTSASEDVVKAHANQFGKDMKVFLDARADEIAVGGMMILNMPALPEGVPHSQLPSSVLTDFVEENLFDMVRAGSISEDEADSFNLPMYFPSLKEMTQLIEINGCFSIERMELTNPRSKIDFPITVPALLTHLRAGFESVFIKHFGSKNVDELFERTHAKSAEISFRFESSYREGTTLFTVLKRK